MVGFNNHDLQFSDSLFKKDPDGRTVLIPDELIRQTATAESLQRKVGKYAITF